MAARGSALRQKVQDTAEVRETPPWWIATTSAWSASGTAGGDRAPGAQGGHRAEEAVVEAALSGEYDAALQALLLDETVPTQWIARAILDEMIELQGELLPPFRRAR